MTKTHNLTAALRKSVYSQNISCAFFFCWGRGGGGIQTQGARTSVASIQGHGNLLHAGDSTSDVSPAFYYPLTSQSRVPQMRYKMSPAPYRVLPLLSQGLRWLTLTANGYGLVFSRHLLSLSEWTRKRRTHVGVFWHKKVVQDHCKLTRTTDRSCLTGLPATFKTQWCIWSSHGYDYEQCNLPTRDVV
jgi:hypothetical protein